MVSNVILRLTQFTCGFIVYCLQAWCVLSLRKRSWLLQYQW